MTTDTVLHSSPFTYPNSDNFEVEKTLDSFFSDEILIASLPFYEAVSLKTL